MPHVRDKDKPGVVQMVKNLLLSILATPLNLLVGGLRLLWSARRIRLIPVIALAGLSLFIVYRFDPLTPVANYLTAQSHKLLAQIGFRVDDVTVEGRQRTQHDDLLRAVNLRPGTPIFAVNLPIVHARVQDLPWVVEVTVMRRLPNILHITLVEREPFALYRGASELVLIDREGLHITSNHLHHFRHLPVFSGTGADLRAASLLDVLQAYPVVRNRLTAAHWVGGRRWTLQLDHGGQLHLPDHNIKAALTRLMKLERKRRVLAIKNQSIDLRLQDRILLRPRKQRRGRDAADMEVAS